MFVKQGFMSPGFIIEVFRIHERLADRHASLRQIDRRANLGLATFLRGVSTGTILLRDGREVLVDNAFLGQVESRTPFRHRYFDLWTGRVRSARLASSIAFAISVLKGKERWQTGLVFVVALILGGLLSVKVTGISPAELISGSRSLQLLPQSLILMLAGLAMLVALSWWEKRAVQPYSGGHLMFAEEKVIQFIRYYYGVEVGAPSGSNIESDNGPQTSPLSPETECTFAIIKAQDAMADRGEKLVKADAQVRFGGNLSARGFLRSWADACRMRPELSEGGRPKK